MCEGRLECEAISEESRILSREDSKRCSTWNIDRTSLERVVKEGILFCNECQTWYPITNYVPVMLDFPIHLHKTFYETNKKTFDSLGSFKIPSNSPRWGEKYVQLSFSRQWGDLGFQDIKFDYKIETLRNYHSVELDWPEWVLNSPGKKLLDVGIGLGQESMILQEITNDEIFGIDLNLSLINSGSVFSNKPFIHPIVASLFQLPFPKSYFDIVFSNGVLHHTFSTKKAFHSILEYMDDQGMIYIWLYARETKFTSLRHHLRDFLEIYVAPIIARFPKLMQDIIVYPIAIKRFLTFKKHSRLSDYEYSFKNALHEERDTWTPRFAHVQSIIEVIEWFQEKGLEYRLLDTLKFKEVVGSSMRNLGIRGIKKSNYKD